MMVSTFSKAMVSSSDITSINAGETNPFSSKSPVAPTTYIFPSAKSTALTSVFASMALEIITGFPKSETSNISIPPSHFGPRVL